MRTGTLFAPTMSCGVVVGCSESSTAPASSLVAEPAGQQREAPAAPIAIVQGSISIEYAAHPIGTAALQGTRGFKLDATLDDGLFPGRGCHFGFDCVPGSTIVLNGW